MICITCMIGMLNRPCREVLKNKKKTTEVKKFKNVKQLQNSLRDRSISNDRFSTCSSAGSEALSYSKNQFDLVMEKLDKMHIKLENVDDKMEKMEKYIITKDAEIDRLKSELEKVKNEAKK